MKGALFARVEIHHAVAEHPVMCLRDSVERAAQRGRVGSSELRARL